MRFILITPVKINIVRVFGDQAETWIPPDQVERAPPGEVIHVVAPHVTNTRTGVTYTSAHEASRLIKQRLANQTSRMWEAQTTLIYRFQELGEAGHGDFFAWFLVGGKWQRQVFDEMQLANYVAPLQGLISRGEGREEIRKHLYSYGIDCLLSPSDMDRLETTIRETSSPMDLG